MTTHCRLYSNISQILLLNKAWRYYNKFDSTESLGVRYRRVKIPQCGYMEHGLIVIAFYVQKHITPCAVAITSSLVCDKLLEAPASVKRVYLWWVNIGLGNGAARQQAIALAIVHPDLFRHNVSLDHNECTTTVVQDQWELRQTEFYRRYCG